MKPVITWVLIADGARARVLESSGPGKGLEPTGPDMHGTTAPVHDLVSDRQGRTFDIGGSGRSAMEPPTDPKDLAEANFLRDVIGRLDDYAKRDSFDRLILVAPPRALAVLRQNLPKRLSDKVTAELAKDLTNIPDPDLPPLLRDVVAF